MISISNTEWKLEIDFHAYLGKPTQPGRSLPLGDRGNVAPGLPNGKVTSPAHDDSSAVKGGTLAALPTETIIGSSMGEGGVMSLYPPNKIHARCDLCQGPIPRYEGYRHAPIGVKRVVCAECQAKLGLPIREEETYANLRD